MGPHPKDLFGPEPSFTEVEKQWEDAAPAADTQGDVIAYGLLIIIAAVCAVHTYKVFTKEN